MEKAVTGKCIKEGGILPDDNVRIYVPMDLNADTIMWQLHSLFSTHGYPTESNESAYSSGVGKIITQLEIYDQVWSARDVGVKEAGGVRHSKQGMASITTSRNVPSIHLPDERVIWRFCQSCVTSTTRQLSSCTPSRTGNTRWLVAERSAITGMSEIRRRTQNKNTACETQTASLKSLRNLSNKWWLKYSLSQAVWTN